MKKLRINVVSESETTVQGHGVHTAYEEMVRALEARRDTEVIRNEFDQQLECDVIHFHTIGSKTFKKLRQNGPIKVMSAHVVPDSFVGSLTGAQFWKPVAAGYLRWFYNKADMLLAVSTTTADELRKIGVKAPIRVVHNSIDTQRYRRSGDEARRRIRQLLGIKDDTFVVIGAGQVQPRKRVDLFLKAAKAMPDVTFIWVGGVPFGRVAADHAAMKKLMNTKLPNLHFPGQVVLDDMVDFYHAADLFWLPSTQETFGLVVLEAAASGLPILLRDITDYDHTFREFADLADDKMFLEHIERFRNDQAFYKKHQKLAGELAQQFDSKTVTDQMVALYRQLIDAKR